MAQTGIDTADRHSGTVVFGFYNKDNPFETNRILSYFNSIVNRVKKESDLENTRDFSKEDQELCRKALDLLRKKL